MQNKWTLVFYRIILNRFCMYVCYCNHHIFWLGAFYKRSFDQFIVKHTVSCKFTEQRYSTFKSRVQTQSGPRDFRFVLMNPPLRRQDHNWKKVEKFLRRGPLFISRSRANSKGDLAAVCSLMCNMLLVGCRCHVPPAPRRLDLIAWIKCMKFSFA